MSDTNDSLDTDIAVVGMAGRFPGARNIGEYWNNLRNGVESLQRFSDEELLAAGVAPALLRNPNYVKAGAVLPDMEMFDAPFFGFSPREASIMDPQHRHFLECAWEALENAGHVPEKFGGSIGVFGGSGHNAYMPYNLMTNPKLMASVGFFLVRHTGNDKDFLTTRVSYLLNLKGPSVNVQTACSTSLVAIHAGVQALLNSECDMVLAGGVTIEMPHRRGYLYEEGEILSPDGHCHAFDAGSQGTVFGSAVGVVVLRRLSDALADGDHIHAVIKGSAINNDGALKVGYMAPSVDGQAQAIAEALAIADVPAETISYIEAHGTGTPVGDPIEVAALTQAHRQSTDKVGYCGIGSVKSNIGHTDTAAGVASFIKVALAMQHGELPPSLHFKEPNPACDFERSPFYVNATLKPWNPPGGVRRAGVSSLGVGGTNAHIILQQAPRSAPSGPSRPYQLLMLSAKTGTALDANGSALAAHFKQHPGVNLADAAYTLNVGRQAMKHRRIVVAQSPAEAAELLTANDPKQVITTQATDGSRGVAFMFAGGGAQYPNMGEGLYQSEPVYRKAVDDCLTLLAKNSATDYRGLLFPAAESAAEVAERLQRPSLALPLLLTTQYAQAMLWMSWGLKPSAMIGHSMGEYTAAHLAGVFSLGDALTLVELRGKLFETLPEGGMLSVPMSEAELAPYMTPELSIAALNGPKLTVASGPVAAIDALQKALEAQEIEASRVRISVAAHSSMLVPILKEFGDFLARVTMKAPTLPFVSNLSGTWITAAEATDPQYWVRHLRNTVRFADGLQELLKDANRVLLEVGPGRTMASLARQHPGRPTTQPVFNSMRHPDEQVADQAYVLGMLGRLWASGASIDWNQFRGDERRKRVQLPSYQFDHVRHWVEPGTAALAAASQDLDAPLYKRDDLTEWFYQPVWKRAARVTAEAGEPLRSLVFVDNTGFGERLAKRLRDTGHNVATVRAGKAYGRRGADDFTIHADKPADYDKVVATLNVEGRAPQAVYHLWSVTGAERLDGGLKVANELQRVGFFSLLNLAQAIGREDLSDPIQIGVVSDRMQRVAGDADLVPAKATLLGPCKVIPQEFRNIRCVSVDVALPAAGSRHEQQLIDGLIADVSGPAGDDVLAYRANERWVQTYESLPLQPRGAQAAGVREGGVYLITGGLGGVGLALGEHLAATAKAKLVLVARGSLPAREQWDAWLRDNDPESTTGRRIRHVKALESLGAEVMVVAADVTDLGQMRDVVKRARARFGVIHGVLHTAGVLNDGVIQLKDAAIASKVLGPKLQGTLVLDAALGAAPNEAPLDFIVLFSSISSFAGLAGQIDYAAANAFLDAYAQDRTARDGTYTVAVNWSQWQEVGMAAELAQQLGIAQDKGTPVGHPLVERCIKDGADERVYATRFSLKTHWLLDEHRVLGGEALIPGTGYLELVRAAFAHHRQPKPVELRDVTFLAPFAVKPDEEKDLQVQFKRAANDVFKFSVTGRSALAAPDAAWTENVRGTVAYVDASVPTPESLTQIAARCTVRTQLFTGSEKQTHLHFGPRWSNIERIDYGQGEALIHLALRAEYAADLTQFALHPAVLDMATGGAQALVPNFDDRADFFVPASYGTLRCFAPLTSKVVSHVRYRADEGGSHDLAVYDVTITDELGRVLVDIEEFTMIRVRDKALLARSGAESTSSAASHKPRATANNVLALGLREGILSSEGAEVLERVLAWQPGPQVVVSPQDLHGFLAQLRAAAKPAPKPAASQGDGAATRGADWQAPTTATEVLIAQMWGEMLGVEHVSASDNFFDLGGHSLLAVQVINKLKKRTGKTLPLTAMLEAPTVAELAGLIEPREASTPTATDAPTADGKPVVAALTPLSTNNTLIRIRAGGSKPPIFFVHDGNGETLLYRTLAYQLDHQHPVYGLQPAMRGDAFVHTHITDMAAAHVEAIRAVQPHGPYFITGLCAGGVISFEMARQLQDAGEVTQYVGIIDAADVQAKERPLVATRERLNRFLGVMGQGEGPALKRIMAAIPTLLRKAANFVKYQAVSRVEQLQNVRKVKSLRDQAADNSDTNATPEISFLKMYEVAHKEHLPSGVFSGGDVVLYRATSGDGSTGDVPFRELYLGEAMGWEARVTGALTITDIPGGHSSALQEPNVKVLARKIQEHIDVALARVPVSSTSEVETEREPGELIADTPRGHDKLTIARPAELSSVNE